MDGATTVAKMSSLVLIADNDCSVSSLLAEVLQRRGVEVRQVFDGEAARDLVQTLAVRVLVCDLDMPRLSGLELLEGLPQDPRSPRVVVVSGYLDSVILERLRRLPNVLEVLRKPFDLLDFAERVVELLAVPSSGEAESVSGG